jgi:hypothetical protein
MGESFFQSKGNSSIGGFSMMSVEIQTLVERWLGVSLSRDY